MQRRASLEQMLEASTESRTSALVWSRKARFALNSMRRQGDR